MSQDFLQYIPHRPPFLFIDRVLEESDDTIKAEKKIDPKEPFFEGHYPGRPIMPGVLIFESIFQAGAIMLGKRMANEARSRFSPGSITLNSSMLFIREIRCRLR